MTILSGVTIGNGAVIGAGSVISKNVEDFAIVVGNPAHFQRYRFSEQTRREILQDPWWDKSDKVINENLTKFMSPPV